METSETFIELLRRLRVERGKKVESLAQAINVSRSQLSNVLAGRRRIDRKQAQDLDRVLGADGELLRAWEIENVKRRTLIKSPMALVPALVSDLRPPTIPKTVTPDDLAQIGVVAHALVTWDNAFGGGQALDHGRTQLEWAQGLLRADCPEELQAGLFAAVGSLAEQAGFMAFDAFHHAYARKLFLFALDCSNGVDDVHLRTSILSSMSRQAVWCGRPHEALARLDEAASYKDQLTATERTTIETVRARAYAKLGPTYAQEALSAVGRADELFADANPTIDPLWVEYYDSAQHHGDTAHALFDVAMHGGRTEAAPRFRFAVRHHLPGYTRSRTISRIKLATLLMASDDPREAASIGQEAVYPAARLKSNRARTDLIALRTQAAMRATIPEAGELIERIDEAIGA